MTKAALRSRLTAGRRAMSDESRAVAREAIRRNVLERYDVEGWACVAAYEPWPSEPGSPELLADLAAAGCRVLVPMTLPDHDLDWRDFGSERTLGFDAIAVADAVFVPASAVAPDGTRLGRGRGSYDRALPRRRPGVPAIAVIFDDEVMPSLPCDEWDVTVDAVVRPAGWTDLPVARLG